MFLNNKIEPLHVSANGGQHRKVTNTSKEMLHLYYVRVLYCKGKNASI
jgi:hypothetical protein